MRVIDRYVLRNFLISYLIIAFVLIGLYVLVDLTLNSDEFTERGDQTAGDVLADIATYYGHQIFVYFRDLSGIITLVSAVVTLATMNRRNEMTAILASGVSLYRIIWPVVIVGLAFNALAVVNQEFILPRMADQLVRSHDEQAGLKRFPIRFYRMFGASSADDRCRIRSVSGPAGQPVGPGSLQAVLAVSPDDDEESADGRGDSERRGRSVPVKAVRQMRSGDVLAVHVAAGPEVRAYVKVRPFESLARPGQPQDQIAVTLADVSQSPGGAWPASRDGHLGRVAAGDRVVLVEPPYYEFDAGWFHPDARLYRMEAVTIVKRHPRTAEPLTMISAKSAAWLPQRQAWRLEDASLVFLAPAPPGEEHLPGESYQHDSALVHTAMTPREVILRHSSHRWMQFMSTADLKRLSETRGAESTDKARAIMHVRFTQPAVNMILLLLGVPFVLTRAPVGLWQGILRCVLLAGSCFILAFVCQQLATDTRGAGATRTAAVVAAWLPVILYGPLSILMLDSVKT